MREGSASGRWRRRVPGLAREVVALGCGGDGPRPQSEHQASGAASVGRRDRATCAAGVWTAGAGAAHHALRWPRRMKEEEEKREEQWQRQQQQQRAGAAGAVLGGGGQDASLERARAGGGSGASRGAPTDRQREAKGRRGFGSQQQRQRQQSASPAWAWESWRLSARRLRHVAGA